MSMQVDPFLGPYDLAEGWVPSLRYLMRRDRILRAMAGFEPGPLLEVGCGAGMLLAELSGCGFDCTGLETSTQAQSLAQKLSTGMEGRYRVTGEAQPDWQGRFAYLAAYDVLEHIEGDEEALRQWREWLKVDGRLLLSVPAHSQRWGPGDEWAGHFRRYDAAPLRDLLDACGFDIEYFECYGFPVANLTEWLGRRGYARLLAKRSRDVARDEATALSGVDRKPYLRVFPYMRSPIAKWLIRFGLAMQSMFSGTDWGSGYLVVARKR